MSNSNAVNVPEYDLRGTTRRHRGIEASIGIKIPIVIKIIQKPTQSVTYIQNEGSTYNDNRTTIINNPPTDTSDKNCQCSKDCCSLEEIRRCINAKQDVCGKRICIGSDLLFKFDRCNIYDLNPVGLDSLKEFAKILKNQNFQIIIEGHTDLSGPPSRNKFLSDCRADMVKNYLIV
ncbi:MAG: OmpA family protein [Bacteroidetes bacterium]|nr:OmpA family protein [Bacteroidota bacterium]